MNDRTSKLSVETILHLLVDFLCAYSLLTTLDKSFLDNTIPMLIMYNGIAFGTQIIFGYIIDKTEFKQAGSIGVLITVVGSILAVFTPELLPMSVFFLGIGNSLFHVGTGVNVIKSANGGLADLGIFISSGTLGIAIGKHYRSNLEIHKYILIVAAAIILSLLYLSVDKKTKYVEYNIHNRTKKEPVIFWITLLCIIARSMSSWVYPTSIENCQWLTIPIAIFLGKFLGGILADNFNVYRFTMTSLGLAVGFSLSSIVYGTLPFNISIVVSFLSNLLMSITLGILLSLLSEYPAFAFGATTLALFIGSLPMFEIEPIQSPVLSALLYAIIAIGLNQVLRKPEEVKENDT